MIIVAKVSAQLPISKCTSNESYKCNLCEKRFEQKGIFKTCAKVRNSTNVIFVTKDFIWNTIFKRHILAIHKKKQSKCESCSKTFENTYFTYDSTWNWFRWTFFPWNWRSTREIWRFFKFFIWCSSLYNVNSINLGHSRIGFPFTSAITNVFLARTTSGMLKP